MVSWWDFSGMINEIPCTDGNNIHKPRILQHNKVLIRFRADIKELFWMFKRN